MAGHDAVLFSWSGSFRDDFPSREDEIVEFIDAMHARGREVGVVASEDHDALEQELPAGIDFVLGHVDNLVAVIESLVAKYDAVFFVSDIRAELVNANNAGAFTVGMARDADAEALGGVGPNYIVDSLAELEQILLLEQGRM